MKRILSLWLPHWPRPEKSAAPAESGSLRKLARRCARYSPLVGFAEQGEPADLLLDITGIGPLFGSEEKLAEKLAADLAAEGHAARIAIAGAVGAAWALCHYGIRTDEGRSEPQAAVPPFILRSSSGNLSALAPLPLEALRLPAETIELLHRLGVFCIEELLRLPRQSLSARFGAGTACRCPLLARLDQAGGAVEEPIVPYLSPPEFQAEQAFEDPVEDRGALMQILAGLIEKVARQLAARRRGAIRLECRFDCAAGEPLCVAVGLVDPSAEPRRLRELFCLRLERQIWPGAVGRVGLYVTLAAPLADRQPELFSDGAPEAERHLALLVERLSGRLGQEAVLRPRLSPDAQPERAWRYVSLVGRRLTSQAGGRRRGGRRARHLLDAPDSSAEAPSGFRPQSLHPTPAVGAGLNEPPTFARPLRILAPPLAIETLAAPGGPPARFTCWGRRRRVLRHWGPERIETGWWRGRSVRRDYYRVETEDGCRYWLFCRLDDGEWFLHGCFA